VRGSLTGSVVGNLLLVLGFSLLFGGRGVLDRESSFASLGLIAVAVLLLLIPSIPGWDGNPERDFIAEQFHAANWLVKSLHQRATTILKVAAEIIRQQDAFFARGVQHLGPLTLRYIADAIGMHESTVSRVTTSKYIATPRGLFELKYFFTSAIASADGGEAHSAEAVRYRIKSLIEQEAPRRILSDDKIVELLRGEGIDIARRTVAKYREAMRIPSSVQRRREKAAML
jgi:RNA polymerase sigma-54 factor